MYQIFIVEDHPMVRAAYQELVDDEADMVVCGMAESAEAALVQLVTLAADLVLVDLSLPGMDGAALIQQLHTAQPDLPTLMVSGHPVARYAAHAKAAGALGYIDKADAADMLIPTIRAVLAGGTN